MQEGTLGNVRTAMSGLACIDKKTATRQTCENGVVFFNMRSVERPLGMTMNPFIVRGILIGGSLGVFAALFGIVDNMARAFILRMIAGGLAGLTLARLRRNKAPVD